MLHSSAIPGPDRAARRADAASQQEPPLAWARLPDAPCAHPAVVPVHEVPYPVTGFTWDEVRAEIRRTGPGSRASADGGMGVADDGEGHPWAGQTSQITRVTCQEGASRLTVTVDAEVVVELPRWTRHGTPGLPADEWDDWLGRLRAHEGGHVALAWPALACLPDRLAGAATCAEVFARHEAVAAEISAAQEAYDAATGHGADG